MMPSENPTDKNSTTTPFAAPSINSNISPSDVPSATPSNDLAVITRYYQFNVADFCDVTYDEVKSQVKSLLTFLNENPEQNGLVSLWVVNVTIVNDKFDYDPYNRNNGNCISTNIGECVIKAFYISGRPSSSPSVSLIPSESTSPSLESSVSYAPSIVRSVAPSISPSTIPLMIASHNPTGISSYVPTLSYAPTANPSESPSGIPSGAPSPKVWGIGGNR